MRAGTVCVCQRINACPRDRLVGGSDAVLVIDDTATPRKGTHSVGVVDASHGRGRS
jgi:hypothetical protein